MSGIHPHMLVAMRDELTKSAGLLDQGLGMAGRLGNTVISGAGRATKALGPHLGAPDLSKRFGALVGKGVTSMGGRESLNQAVGLGAAGLGLGAAGLGAGYMAGRAQR